jgi:transcriptional regulator with XRE-family HTH domain
MPGPSAPFGIRVRRLRNRLGWTAVHLAHLAGIGHNSLSKIERGKKIKAEVTKRLELFLDSQLPGALDKIQ